MANAQKADFELIIGADIGLSTTQLRSDIETILNTIEKDPPKIKLKFDLDDKKITEDLKDKKIDVDKILDASKASKSLGSADQQLQKISTDLSNILRVIEQINAKSFQINLGKGAEKAKVDVSYYKDVLKAYTDYLTEVEKSRDILEAQTLQSKSARSRDSYTKSLQSILSATSVKDFGQYLDFTSKVGGELQKINDLLGDPTVTPSVIGKRIVQLERYKEIYQEIFDVAKQRGVEIELPNTSNLDQAIAALSHQKDVVEQENQALRDATKNLISNGGITPAATAVANAFGQAGDAAASAATQVQTINVVAGTSASNLIEVGNAAKKSTLQMVEFGDSVKTVTVPLNELTGNKIADIEKALSGSSGKGPSLGISTEDAKQITEHLKDIDGQITKVKVNFGTFKGDEHVTSVLVKAVDNAGVAFEKLIKYQRKVGKDGSVTWEAVKSGAAQYTMAVEKATAATKASEEAINYIDKGKAINELQSLQLDVQKNLDNASLSGIADNEAVDRLRSCQRAFSDLEGVVRSASVEEKNYKLITDAIKASVTEANKELGFAVAQHRDEEKAANAAAKAKAELVNMTKAQADVEERVRKVDKLTTDAQLNGIGDSNNNYRKVQEYSNALKELLRDTDANSTTQKKWNEALSNLDAQYRSVTNSLKDDISAEREAVKSKSELVKVTEAQARVSKEVERANILIEKATKLGAADGKESEFQTNVQSLRDYIGRLNDLSGSIDPATTKQRDFDNTFREIVASSTEAKLALESNARAVKEETAAAREAEKAKAALVDRTRAQAEVEAELNKVIGPIYGDAIKNGISESDPGMQQLQAYASELYALYDWMQNDANMTQAEFEGHLKNIKAYYSSSTAAVKQSTAVAKEAAKAEKELNTNLRASEKTREAITAAVERYKKAESSSNADVRQSYSNIQTLTSGLIELENKYKSGEISAEQFKKGVADANIELRTSSKSLDEAGYGVEGLSTKFAYLTRELGRFLSPFLLVRRAWQTIKEMANTVIELEDAFASLQIVTGATDKELEDFYDTASDISAKLGKSITDIASSIEVFSRLGYSLPDATVLAEYATILSNVASVTTDEATTGLTSIIKGYNMHVDQAEHVSDVLVSIGQRYAVSAGEMMEAYEKSGAALAATNTSFEKSAALIAAANSAVQNSSIVGTALKTVSARIRGSKTDLEELGEGVEDLADGFSKYAKELQALTGVNIMVEGTTNEFKDLYDIMDEIADVWGDLTDTQQARTAEILGGTRQLQVIASIINNWKDAQGAYVDAQNSAGEAARANSIYMDTATAHMNQFKAAFQDLSHTVIDSGLIKGIVDLGTGLLNLATTIAGFIKSIGGIPPILGVIIGLLATFRKLSIGTIIEASLGKVIELIGAMKTLSFTFSSFTGVVGLVVTAFSLLSAAITGVNNAISESRERIIQDGKAAAEESAELTELVRKYLDLNEVSAANEDTIAARDEVIDKLGLERSKVAELAAEYGSYSEAIKHVTAEELKRQRATLTGALNAAKQQLTSDYSDIGKVNISGPRNSGVSAAADMKAFNTLNGAGYVSSYSPGLLGSSIQFDFGDLSDYQNLITAYEKIHQMMDLLIADGSESTTIYQTLYDLYNRLGEGVNAYNTALQNMLSNELQQQYLAQGIPQTTAEYESMRQAMIQAVMASDQFNGTMETATTIVDDFLGRQSGLSEFANGVQNAFSGITSGADALSAVHSAFDKIKGVFDDVTQSLQAVNSMQDLVAEGFVVDTEKAMELAAAYPEILDNATVTADGQLQLNEETVNSFIEGKQGEINAAIDAKIADLEADASVLEAKKALAQAELDVAYNVAEGQGTIDAERLQNRIDNANNVVDALIKMGYDEADAYQAVMQHISDNTSILDGNVGDAAENIAHNLGAASEAGAASFDANVSAMNTGMGNLIANAHQTALAIKAMATGDQEGNIVTYVGGGSVGPFTANRTTTKQALINAQLKQRQRQSVDIKDIISKLNTDISGYTSAIGAIRGQISALESLRSTAMGKISNYRPSASGGSGRGSGGSGSGGGGGGGGSGSSSSEKEETWFQKQYKLHQHYVNMDQETTADFLKWLEKAYKQAYKEGIITLDEYYKYEEEIYNGYNKIKEAAKSTFDALVDYRVKMLKQDRENQKDSINDQLNDLKDFYNKQKEMLQKQQDEQKYLDEQTDKRKSVNDIKQQIAQLQFDTSAWAQKRRQELLQELSDAEKDLQDFEDQHALEEALNALDEAYNAEEERLNKQIEAIDEVLNDPDALYNQALADIKGNTEDLFKAFILFNKKYGDGDDETIKKLWEEAFKNNEDYKKIVGKYYEDTKIGNYTGYKAPTPPTNPQPPTSSSSSSKSSSSSSSSSRSSAPSLSSGSTVQVKTSATHFSPKSGSVRMASFVPGGQYTVYQTSGNEVLIGRGGVYTGWIYRSDIVGYKKGTKNATPGLHKINEEGTEAIFSSGDGNQYRMFNGGEKVLNAKATNFLYEFAMAGAEILDKMRGASKDVFRGVGTINQPIDINMGDIIINGNIDKQSVSDIRRAQREQVNDVLKAFNKYQITLYRGVRK